jgi:hypothetical protein
MKCKQKRKRKRKINKGEELLELGIEIMFVRH